MRIEKLIILIPFCILLACKPFSKDQFMSRYESFMDNVKENHEDFNDTDWDRKDEQLEEMLDEWYPEFEEDFTRKERTRIWSDAMQYAIYRHGNELENFWSDNGEELSEMIRLHAKDISKETREALKEIVPEIKEVLPELKEAGREILKELIEAGKELEKELEKN